MTNEELVNQIQQGINSCECLEQLYTQNKGLINKIVKKFEYVYHVNNSKTSIPLIEYQELMDEAYFGLLEAVNRYEDTAGVKFMTYAPFWIRQSIQNYIRNNINSIRIPRHLYEKITVYKKVVGAYEAQLYRKPSDKELCRALGIEIKALNELKKVIYNCNMIDSLDREISDEDDTILCDTISGDADVENIVIDDMMDKSLKTELWQIVKENTTNQENMVMRCRYINRLSLEATGEAIGQTKDKVRALETKALRQLRMPKLSRMLAEKFEINYARGYNGRLSTFKYTSTSIVEDIVIKNLMVYAAEN